MINVALLSRWHVHAEDYAKEAGENPEITISAVWDEEKERGEKWAGELGVRFEHNLDVLLSDETIHAVIVDTPTADHKEIITKAASYGKHIFTEKVLGLTGEDCEEIFTAAEQNNVSLMLSLPRLREGYYLLAQDMLDKGLLGKLTLIRCRVAHNGAIPTADSPHGWLPEHFLKKDGTGGGALIDLGAHPIYLTNRLAGPIKSMSARLSHFFDYEVDDHAAVLVDYQSGALGIIEAGFVSSGSFTLELHGTEGIYLVDGNQVRFKTSHLNNGEWVVSPELPENLPSAMQQWMDHILRGKEPAIKREDMLELTRFNEWAIQSDREGKRIEI
ncbi:Gfo/Idh/MocA family protein [Jeotgalibacillus proteolyticus]|uniref:Gfo/Idh/MocA family oxidoreductase n=1 Tax=Jeotgalibacillus proteolyticus TaxID=2082395 RepID=A0A2S5GCK6_9BACL|nr:Gfo/Idh/MocA family oxidoreductase [Jeotgalibacillus proteolyticus]PPA70729.1 gfo/Idh/MocA family oxidoreductase [Jeotgalibacillus proteolyticus]